MPSSPAVTADSSLPLGQTAVDGEVQDRAKTMMDGPMSAQGGPPTTADPPFKAHITAPMMFASTAVASGPAPQAAAAPALAHPHDARPPLAPTAPMAAPVAAPLASAVEPEPAPAARHSPAMTLMGSGPASALSPPQGPPAQPPGIDKRTMLGLAASDLLPQQPPQQQPPPAGSQAPGSDKRTMLGLAASDLLPQQPSAPPASLLAASAGAGSDKRTLLGVAMPGIAPTRESIPHEVAGHSGPQPGRNPQHFATAVGLGEAPIAVLPAPAPYVDESLPQAPVKGRKRGLPLVGVLGAALAVVVVLGVVLVLALRSRSSPLTVRPKMGEAGKEFLLVRCETCDDGTVITLGAERGATKAREAEVPAALKVGDNALTLHLDRPGSGRDEDVKVSVPVAYRVKADLSTLTADVPVVTVRIEALKGSSVTVDGKAVTLDASGRGASTVDIGDDAKGALGETKTFERNIAFEVKPATGPAEKGSLLSRAAIVPLVLDAPAETPVTATGTLVLVGRTVKGARVTVGGAPAQVDANGAFRVEVPMDVGPKKISIVSSSPPLATRRLEITGERFATTDAAVTRLEAIGLPGYDSFGADPSASKGKLVAIEGDVLESRAAGAVAILLVDDRRGCARGPCIVRVLHTSFVARGEHVRAYARVNGGVTAAGKTVPEVAAEFVAIGKSKR